MEILSVGRLGKCGTPGSDLRPRLPSGYYRAILAALPDDLDPVIQNLRYYYDDFDSTSGSDDGEIVPN